MVSRFEIRAPLPFVMAGLVPAMTGARERKLDFGTGTPSGSGTACRPSKDGIILPIIPIGRERRR